MCGFNLAGSVLSGKRPKNTGPATNSRSSWHLAGYRVKAEVESKATLLIRGQKR